MSLTRINPALYQRAAKLAQEQSTAITDVVDVALQQYFWELDRRKIAEESEHYRHQYSQLRDKYLGHYIAMHNGEIVDHDKDFEQLRARVQQHWPDTAVMITLVTEQATPTLERRGFRIE